MFILSGALLLLIGGLFIWFRVPYSPVKNNFQNDISTLITENRVQTERELFIKEDFLHLPIAIQTYIESCGYIGTPKMSCLKMDYKNVAFMRGRNTPALSIDYTQYNFINEPCRLALIDSSLFGIPFEGYDYYQKGKGGMKGVIGKTITLFNQTGNDIDKACLATFLAESLFAPTILLQDYIAFEQLSDFEVRAAITYGGQNASGIFTLNELNEMTSFTTNDRAVVKNDGAMDYVPWSALCGEYQLTERGIKYPTKLQAVWNYPDGDFTYFDGIINEVSYT